MLGLGLSIPQVAARGSRSLVAAIRSLFAASEPGVWYDPSDLSTLFQDAAGTTPVTAVEQPVGLMLDKSKGLVLGPELVTNGTFDTDLTGWNQPAGAAKMTWGSGAAVSSGTQMEAIIQPNVFTPGKFYEVLFDVTAISGGSLILRHRNTDLGGPANTITTLSSPGSYSVLWQHPVGTTLNGLLFLSGSSTSCTIDNISVRELPGNHAYQTTATSRPVLSARVNQYLATETLTTQNVTTLAAQYRLSFEGTGTITLSGSATGVYLAGLHLITCTAGTLTSTVSGSVTKADLRVANDGANLPPYQRVNTSTDYDTAGFPHYLRFDGVDDWLVTNTITPGIDKAQVFTGVRKLSDTALGSLVELSSNYNTNLGGFLVSVPDGANTRFSAAMSNGGNPYNYAYYTDSAAPLTTVNTVTFDKALSSDEITAIRKNGTNQSLTRPLNGNTTGNFLAYPLYIGRRGGTSLPFNGHIYSLIVRFGNNLPIKTIEQSEAWINGKTGAY